MSELIDLADHIAGELTSASLSQAIDVRRSYLPEYELQDRDAVLVTVIPKEVKMRPLTRSRQRWEVSIDVAVQQKLDSLANEAIDPLMSLTEEVADVLRGRERRIRIENRPIFAQEHLHEKRLFTSLITVTIPIYR